MTSVGVRAAVVLTRTGLGTAADIQRFSRFQQSLESEREREREREHGSCKASVMLQSESGETTAGTQDCRNREGKYTIVQFGRQNKPRKTKRNPCRQARNEKENYAHTRMHGAFCRPTAIHGHLAGFWRFQRTRMRQRSFRFADAERYEA